MKRPHRGPEIEIYQRHLRSEFWQGFLIGSIIMGILIGGIAMIFLS